MSTSYSRGNLVLANIGNPVHSVYVIRLPAGPIWALHSFYVVSSALMLVWHLHYVGIPPRPDANPATLGDLMSTNRSRPSSSAPDRPAWPPLPPPAAGAVLPGPRRATSGSGTTGGRSGTRLRLYSPAGWDGLPGLPFPGPRWSYPTKDDLADYLAAYVDRLALPVRTGVRVDRLEATDGGYTVRPVRRPSWPRTSSWPPGTFGRTPNIPEFALELDPSIRAAALQRVPPAGPAAPGLVLVVGASHSGHRYRLRGARQAPDGAGGGRDRGSCPSGWTTGAPGSSGRAFLFVGRHLITRRTPDGAPGDGRGPGARRPDDPGEAATWRPAGSSGSWPG